MKRSSKGFFPIVLVLLAFLAFYLSCGGDKSSDPPPPPIDEWTILSFGDGNNDLDYAEGGNSYCIESVQNMQKVGSSDKVNVIAMVSSLKTGGNAKTYYVEHIPDDLGDSISSTVLQDLGGKDMSNPQILKEFLTFGITNYPAKRYMVIIDDHGGGWRGACVDEQNGSGNMMTMPDMANAFESALDETNVDKFDVIAYHACLMSMVEVAYELRNSTDYVVASEFSMPMESIFGTTEWLGDLVDNPTTNGEDLAKKIVTAVYNAGVAKQKYVHMAATDLSQVTRLASKIDNLGIQLRTTATAYWWEVYLAWFSTWTTELDDPAFVDIRDFANQLKQQENLQTINLVKNAADSVLAAINDAVVMTKTNVPGVTRGGLTIHMPYLMEMYDSTNYATLDFDVVPWTNFLSYYIRGLEPFLSQATISGTVSWPGHTLSNYTYAFADSAVNSTLYFVAEADVNPANGSYTLTISNLTTPIQLLFEAQDDVNNSGPWYPIDIGDGWGYYDYNSSGTWDSGDKMTVSPGDNLTGINITLQEETPGKVSAKMSRVIMIVEP